MPPRQKGKKIDREPAATRKNIKKTTGKIGTKAKSESATTQTLQRGIASRLRPRPAPKTAPEADTQPPIRKPQTSRKTKRTARDPASSATDGQLERVVQSIEAPLAKGYGQVDQESDHYFDSETSLALRDTDPEQTFYRKWGYLPPLDEEVVAIIEEIMANSGSGKERLTIGPESNDFANGLRNRNVLLGESASPDPFVKHIMDMKPNEFAEESIEETVSHGQLWDLDLKKCTQGSNEALFQRTVMMFLIARHCLIYKADENPQYLDFSVEEPWTCFPMPTRAYERKEKFLTQPKPDLAVCFVRKPLIPNSLWNKMPKAKQRLACYENMTEMGTERVFHFCTVEAKKSLSSPDNDAAKRQSLNNASQALHNMFEFFKDAGEQHEEIFFDRVRFFSVVASTEGLTIRIHRAVRESGAEEGFIVPQYPLRFEYQVFLKVLKNNYDRRMVFETFAKILVGYGANELRLLLNGAATAIMTKLDNDPDAKLLRQEASFYRYGQTEIAVSSRKPTPALSAYIPLDKSIDMDRSQTTTPGPGTSFTISKTSRAKRARSQPSEDGRQAGRSRQRKV